MAVNQSAPDASVVPILVYADVARAIDWLCSTFGFAERLRHERDGVVGHAQLVVGTGAIMIGREGGEFHAPHRDGISQFVHIAVDDVDRHFAHAKQSGARIVSPPHDLPFGERQYTAEDPEGHRWVFSQHVADVAPHQWGAKLAAP